MSGSAPIGMVAGGGRLPLLVANALNQAGEELLILKLSGQNCLLQEGETLSLGQVGKMFRALRIARVEKLVLCGTVSVPDMQSLNLDPRGMMLMPSVMAASQKGEDGLMRFIAKTFSQEGYDIIRPDQLVPELAMPLGVLGETQLTDAHHQDIARGLKELEVLGERDEGQACIVSAGKIIAVENETGTDAMLITCYAPNGGVLVKGPKPDQTLLLDMPVIGPETAHHAATAGLHGIAMVAHGSLIVDREDLIGLANQSGLFVTGIER